MVSFLSRWINLDLFSHSFIMYCFLKLCVYYYYYWIPFLTIKKKPKKSLSIYACGSRNHYYGACYCNSDIIPIYKNIHFHKKVFLMFKKKKKETCWNNVNYIQMQQRYVLCILSFLLRNSSWCQLCIISCSM